MASELPDDTAAAGDSGGRPALAGYRVIVRARPHAEADPYEGDRALLEVLLRGAPELEAEIARAASQTLGPSITAEIRDIRPTESVAIVVALTSLYEIAGGGQSLVLGLRQYTGTLETIVGDFFGGRGWDVDVTAVLDEASLALAEPAADGATPWEHIAPILGAIAGGIGVLGLVTFVGGAIQYARFDAAGLPAEDALTVLPTANLVVVGANTLAPAVAFALFALIVLFVVRTGLYARARFQGLEMPATGAGLVAATDAAEESRSAIRAGLMGVYVGAIALGAFIFTLELNGPLEVGVGAAIGILLMLVVGCVAFLTPKFLWLGAATFLGLAVFLSSVELARAWRNSDVRGAAIVRDNKKGTIGFFVAESSDRVYLGRTNLGKGDDIDEGQSRLMGFAKAQITDIAIGPPKEFQDARNQARALREEICGLEPQVSPKPPKTTVENCGSKPPGE
jgi:hypothetical protein